MRNAVGLSATRMLVVLGIEASRLANNSDRAARALRHIRPATSTPYCSARADVRKDAAIIRPLGCTALAARNPACPLAEADRDSG